MVSRRFAAVLGVVALLVLLSGCAALESPSSNGADDPSPDSEPDPAALFESAFVHSDDLEDVQGEVTTEATDGAVTVTEVEQVYERPYVDRRTEVLEATDPNRVGEQYISNASMSWWYDPDAEWASYYESEEPFDSDEVRSYRAETAEEQLEWYDLEYAGTETIADRETHVLEVEAKAEAVERGLSILVGDVEYVYALETVDPSAELDVVEQTIWIDTTYEFPLKERLVVEDSDGERHVMTERFETVTFNAGLEDERFAFEPPANTTVESS